MDVSDLILRLKSGGVKEKADAAGRLSRIAFHNPLDAAPALPCFKEGLQSGVDEIVFKSAWAAGQVAHKRADLVCGFVPALVNLFRHANAKARCNALWAFGRIGRADGRYVSAYMNDLFLTADDRDPRVRHNMIWACENIATHHPELVEHKLDVFRALLFDGDVKHVRREAPELFRVVGKRIPQRAAPYLPDLQTLLSDDDRVVRIHAEGAIRSINMGLSKLNHRARDPL